MTETTEEDIAMRSRKQAARLARREPRRVLRNKLNYARNVFPSFSEIISNPIADNNNNHDTQ